MSQEAYIFDAIRSPRGKGKNGSLNELTAVSLSAQVLSTLKERNKDYDPKITQSLSDLIVIAEETSTLQEIKIDDIDIGMRLSQELKLDDGFLIAAAGTDVDRQLLKVIRNYNSCYAESPFPKRIQVIVPVNLLK